MPLANGSVLHDRYRIDGQLGKGGMGAVYLAFDMTLQIKVALKENLNVNPESERQFKREATLLATLRHPNLPRVTDHFILEGRQYLVMDYIEGEDLHTRQAHQPATVEEVLRWADSLCDALQYLHTREPSIIHRDIKPANIKLQPDGNVILVDFGIAKVYGQTQTTTGARGLTPGFSPPEQYGGSRTSAASDQYALAATLYSLLVGRPPADSIERIMKKQDLIQARQRNPAVSAAVDAALTRAMALDPDERFTDMMAFKAALQGMGSAPTVRADALPLPAKRRSIGMWVVGAAAGGLLLVGGGAVILFSGLLHPSRPTSAPTLTSAVVALLPSATRAASDTPVPATSTPEPQASPTPEPTQLTGPLIGGGGRIAFVSDRADGHTLQVWVMDPDGSNPVQFTFGPGDKTQPRWSPDGQRLLYVGPAGTDSLGNKLGFDIWLINANGTGLTDITSSPGDDVDPAWSPDGSKIAFTSNRINNLNQVFIMDAACPPAPDACTLGKPRNLSAGYAVESDPAWSPDGATLAVSASINGAPGRIFMRSPSGGDPTRFDPRDKIIGAENLAWSPDGQLIAFAWIQPTMNEVWLARLADRGASPIRLTNTLGNKDPVFSPDGLYIAFTSTRDQNPEIYRMTSNGADQQNLTSNPGRDMQPDWQHLPAN
jgi:serine/threonine protein kinase